MSLVRRVGLKGNLYINRYYQQGWLSEVMRRPILEPKWLWVITIPLKGQRTHAYSHAHTLASFGWAHTHTRTHTRTRGGWRPRAATGCGRPTLGHASLGILYAQYAGWGKRDILSLPLRSHPNTECATEDKQASRARVSRDPLTRPLWHYRPRADDANHCTM